MKPRITNIFYKNAIADDRLYVLNLFQGKESDISCFYFGSMGTASNESDNETDSWIIARYANLSGGPKLREVHTCIDYADAVSAIMLVEPMTKLVSRRGESLDYPQGATVEEKWAIWEQYLKDKGYKSALSGFQNLPRICHENNKEHRMWMKESCELNNFFD